jgi:hypothetical protein
MPPNKHKKKFTDEDRKRARKFSVGHSWFGQNVDRAEEENEQEIEMHASEDSSCDENYEDRGTTSASKAKINLEREDNYQETIMGRRIIDMDLLQDTLLTSAVCGVCKEGSLSVWENPIAGWAAQLCFVCNNESCFKSEVTQGSSFFSSKKDGRQFEVNKVLVLAMRNIGRGFHAATKFSAIMDLPKPVNATSYAGHTKEWEKIAEEGTLKSMQEAGSELRERLIAMCDEPVEDDAEIDCAVSVDGSWLSRGRHSRHGFVSAISDLTGKVLDCHHLSSTCRECELHKNLDTGGLEYLEWYTQHEPDCTLNHEGSPQSMESKGAVILFNRSVNTHGLRYKYFIGDGDSKSYNSVVKAAPYGPTFVIVKLECTGHVQKRMGTRLRNVVSQYKGEFNVLLICSADLKTQMTKTPNELF